MKTHESRFTLHFYSSPMSSPMPTISLSRLHAYRAQTYRAAPGLRLASLEDAVRFVNQRGFVLFWPNKGVELPSLWAAVAGNRPVADEHDDPAHVTWGWKDDSLGLKRWYYGRIIKHRNAMISLEVMPFFYALSPNYGEPEEDYLFQYEQGQLRPEAKWVYEALLHEGPLDTLSLRKAAHLSSNTSDGRFNRALDDLQMEFKILPIGIAPVGPWRYAFIYECTHRHHPELFTQVTDRAISEIMARQKIAELYFNSVGAARLSEMARLFLWRLSDAQKVIETLLASGLIRPAAHPQFNKEDWFALPVTLED
ncbi:MAG TPA: hypothetical protein VMS73_08720 [Anaerolineaceae bacterium]|nr:hypothetical protein [Anaerolineaceae bacterium]